MTVEARRQAPDYQTIFNTPLRETLCRWDRVLARRSGVLPISKTDLIHGLTTIVGLPTADARSLYGYLVSSNILGTQGENGVSVFDEDASRGVIALGFALRQDKGTRPGKWGRMTEDTRNLLGTHEIASRLKR